MRDSWLLYVLTVSVLWSCSGQPGSEETPATSPPQSHSEGSSAVPTAPTAEPPVPPPEAEAEDRARAFDFDRDTPGQTPAGFEVAVGAWQVVEDAEAPSGERALAQRAQNGDADFNVVLATGTSYTDVDVTVTLRAVAGRIDRGGGLVWRAQGARDYYVARYNPLEDNLRLYTVVNGVRRMLESASPRLDHAAWHTLRVVMRGDHIECFLDGVRRLEAHDTTFPAAGRVGLWTKADAQTHFDSLRAREASGEAE